MSKDIKVGSICRVIRSSSVYRYSEGKVIEIKENDYYFPYRIKFIKCILNGKERDKDIILNYHKDELELLMNRNGANS